MIKLLKNGVFGVSWKDLEYLGEALINFYL